MIKLSFILPCYNVERYIARCLDSLLNQDLPLDEYEIICVNDCSPDHLRGVIQDYQTKYPNITLIEHEINKTAGGARNTGLEIARGEYVWFVDPDDEIERFVLCGLYESAKVARLDTLLFGHKTYDETGVLIDASKRINSLQTCDGQFYIEKYFSGELSKICMMVNVIYRRQFLLEKHIFFPCIKASQDVVFAWTALIRSSRVLSVDTIGYIVHKRPDSTTGRRGRCKADNIYSRTVLFPIEVDGIRRSLHSEVISNDLRRVIRWSVNDLLFSLSNTERVERRVFYNLVKHHREMISGITAYMNRATRLLMTSHPPFWVWDLLSKILQISKGIRKKG